MNGRETSDNRYYNRIEYKLNLMPEYATEWYYHLRANRMKASTCYNYINKLYQLLFFIDWSRTSEIKTEELTPQIIEKYIISLQSIKEDGKIRKSSDAYQANTWSCLNNFFEFLNKREYTEKNIIEKAGLEKPRVRDEVKRIHLTKKDFSKIIKTVSYGKEEDPIRCRDTAILLLFMTTGMRKMALDSINISDLNLSSSILDTIEVVDKGERKHEYELTDQTRQALLDWLEMRPLLAGGYDDDALFISYQGLRLSGNSIYKIVKKWTKEALGIELSPHKLRGGFITIMIDETGDIAATSEAVGHKNVSTTQRYYASVGRGKKLAAKVMGNI